MTDTLYKFHRPDTITRGRRAAEEIGRDWLEKTVTMSRRPASVSAFIRLYKAAVVLFGEGERDPVGAVTRAGVESRDVRDIEAISALRAAVRSLERDRVGEEDLGEEFFSITEAARRLRVPVRTLRDWGKRGKVAIVARGHSASVERAEIDRLEREGVFRRKRTA